MMTRFAVQSLGLSICLSLVGSIACAQPSPNPDQVPQESLEFRKPFLLKLHVDSEHYYEERIDRPIPFVANGDVYLFAGESFGLKVKTRGGQIEAVRHLGSKAGADIELEFKQVRLKDDAASMMLTIRNNLSFVVAMDALMTVPGESRVARTTILPIGPGTANYESWPHAIVQLVLRNIRVGAPSPLLDTASVSGSRATTR